MAQTEMSHGRSRLKYLCIRTVYCYTYRGKRLLMQMDTFKGTQTAGVHAP